MTRDDINARKAMVRDQIAARGISDPAVLAAMEEIPREAFLPDHLKGSAYEDRALPIAAGQTISQPYIVAKMAALAGLHKDGKCLEVGAGSGYAAAVLSRLCAHVWAIERHGALARTARAVLNRLEIHNVTIIHGDGSGGLPEHAPFDAIIVSAGGGGAPAALKSQLKTGGFLVMPVSEGGFQVLTRIKRCAGDKFTQERFDYVRFVPLVAGAAN